MNEPVSAILVRLCAFLIGITAIVVVLQLATTQAFGANSTSSDLFSSSASSPNVITGSMVTIANRLGAATAATGKSISSAVADTFASIGSGAAASVHAVQRVTTSTGRAFARMANGNTRSVRLAAITSTRFVGQVAVDLVVFNVQGVGNGLGLMGRMVVGTMTGIGGVLTHVGSSVTNTAVMSSMIRPADHKAVPEIDSPDVMTVATEDYVQARTPAPPKPVTSPLTNTPPPPRPIATASSGTPQWPIHGMITLSFGANDMPFELHHTGIDISDGKPAGTTPVHPYKPGKVKSIGCGDAGYGNCVIIDNGGGITSWYAHMDSISVQVGQQVDENTVLGYEGATGDVTGVHLHFEIRFNNIPVNPEGYITGNP